MPEALTVREIAAREGFTVDQVQHVVRTRGIQFSARRGATRLFGPRAQARILAALREIAVRSRPSSPR